MSDDRDIVLARIREALAGLESRAPRPEFDDALPTARDPAAGRPPLEVFMERFRAAAGRVVEGPGDLVALLAETGVACAYVDPRLPPVLATALDAAGVEVVDTFDRRRAEEIGAAVTPATGAVAETGSLVLCDADTHDRLAAVAPWVHVAVLDPETVEPTLVAALARLPEDPNVVLVTGPSQTADVEGILIRGVHGPGIQACLTMAWRNLRRDNVKPPGRQPAIRITMRPKDTNALGSIFGGVITSLIDEAAFVEATRQAPRKYVTVAMDKIEFHKPVRVGDIVSLWAETLRIGRTSITMRVDVLARSRDSDEEVKVTTAEVTMVATDTSNRPTPIFSH